MSCHVKIATKITKKATPSLTHLFSLCSEGPDFGQKRPLIPMQLGSEVFIAPPDGGFGRYYFCNSAKQ